VSVLAAAGSGPTADYTEDSAQTAAAVVVVVGTAVAEFRTAPAAPGPAGVEERSTPSVVTEVAAAVTALADIQYSSVQEKPIAGHDCTQCCNWSSLVVDMQQRVDWRGHVVASADV
jgi:hypothetical protein